MSSGHVQWEALLRSNPGQPPQQLYEPLDLGSKIAFTSQGDIIVLSRGHVVNRLDAKTGEIKWTWTSDENVTGSTLVDLVAGGDGLTVISMIQSFASPQLATTKLDMQSGSIVEQTKPVKINLDSPKDYIVTESSNIHWIDSRTRQIKSASLNAIDKQVSSGLKGEYRKIHDIGLTASGVFAAQHADGSEHVISKHDKKPLGLKAFQTRFGQSTLWQKSSAPEQIVQGVQTETGFEVGIQESIRPMTARRAHETMLDSQVMIYDPKDISGVAVHNGIKHDFAEHGHVISVSACPALFCRTCIHLCCDRLLPDPSRITA